MKKVPKAKKETLKSVTAAFYTWRLAAKDYIYKLRNPQSRQLLNVEAADPTGKVNGISIPELIAIANLLAQQGEKLYLVAQGKSIYGFAVKDPSMNTPVELL
jgi:hypothetical protein